MLPDEVGNRELTDNVSGATQCDDLLSTDFLHAVKSHPGGVDLPEIQLQTVALPDLSALSFS